MMRGTCLQRNPTCPKMSTILSQKEPCISANEYISTQECAEEPYVFTKEPYISAKKTYISATKPSIFQECAALRTLLLGKAMMSTPHVLQCVAVCCSICSSVLQCVAVSVAVCCSICCSVLQCVAVCCSICCSVLQYRPLCRPLLWMYAGLFCRDRELFLQRHRAIL